MIGIILAVVSVLTFTGTAIAAPGSSLPGALRICNAGTSVTLGVIHTPDGSYDRGNYDAILNKAITEFPNDCTRSSASTTSHLNWPHAGGFYIPPGYIADMYNHALVFLASQKGNASGSWKFFNNVNETYYVKLRVDPTTAP